MKSASPQSNPAKPSTPAIRLILAATVISPFLFAAACDLRKPDAGDGGVATAVTVTAPATTGTAPTADTAAAATVAPVIAATPQSLAGAKRTGKIVKLVDGGTGAVVTLGDGGTAVVPSNADGGIPGFPSFSLPTALPTNLAIPSSIPTTLPSGFHLPTLPPAPTASH